jgi:hypothetical protein
MHIGIVLEEGANNFLMTSAGRLVKWCFMIPFRHIHFRVVLEEIAGNFVMSLFGCQVKRSLTNVVLDIRIGSVL